MAKATIKVAPDPKNKKKSKADSGATLRIKVKGAKKDGGKKAKKSKAKDGGHGAIEGLAKLIDHPLVADLLAAGALAAVTAIADHQFNKQDGKKSISSKLVKDAGKAAAAAIGKKLMGDLGAIKDAATDAAKKA